MRDRRSHKRAPNARRIVEIRRHELDAMQRAARVLLADHPADRIPDVSPTRIVRPKGFERPTLCFVVLPAYWETKPETPSLRQTV
jgi:hypothetical protein